MSAFAERLFGRQTLASYDRGRDNNFNLLRAIAALLVIYSHCFALSGRSETIWGVTSLGTLGVRLFFVMSGFLITKSFLNRQSLRLFLMARFFRIYPGAWVAVLFCTLVVGGYFTTLQMSAYLEHSATQSFLWKNLTLLTGVHGSLPGVFTGNPHPGGGNGSLWTLQYELILYLITGLLGALAVLQNKRSYLIVLGLTVLSYIFFKTSGFANLTAFLKGSGLRADRWLDLSLLFLFGGAFCIFRDRVPMNWPLAICSIFTVIASYRWGLRDWVLPLSFTYAVLALAFLPCGWVRRFNQLGDYSYGLYVYAFPVQQSLMALYLRHHPEVTVIKRKTAAWDVWPYFWSSMLITLVLAVLSWHLVEKPAMRLFTHLTRRKGKEDEPERRW